ncbi:MAG TPA: hypothetical protein VLG38_07075, partial [Gammaproteobacteria bacterium]|nr:hypothetical protein [Gammaproteobacteria bacterium]
MSFSIMCWAGFFAHINCAIADDTSFTLDVDKYNSPYMGADWMIAGLRAYQAIDDVVASGTVGNDTTCMTLIRGAKWGLEFTLSSFAAVLQHEIFGHGARAREFNIPNVGYHIHVFSGATTYPSSSYNALSPNQQAALSAGGVEATSILSQQIEINWMRMGSLDSRAATLYLVNSFDESVYAFGLGGNFLHPDNDSSAYLNAVNAWFGNQALNEKKLKTDVAWNWLDPMIYMSAYSLLNYIWFGHTSQCFSFLHIGESRFMPTTRTYLAPYGPEFHLLLNLFTPQEKYIGINLRYGKTQGKAAAGLDINVSPISANDCFYLTNKISAWRQPHLLQPGTAATNTPKWGFADYIGLYYRLNKGIYVKGEIGYKLS